MRTPLKLSILLACSIIANGCLLLRENGLKDSNLDEALGKMVRASLRFPPGKVAASLVNISEPSLEDVFSSIGEDIWGSMIEKEKLELTIVALLYCDMHGGDIVSLKMLLDDNQSVANSLAAMKEPLLAGIHGWNDERRLSFRDQMDFLLYQKNFKEQ